MTLGERLGVAGPGGTDRESGGRDPSMAKPGLPIKISARATHEFWEIPVLFEDEWLLALDKPAGLPTSPDPLAPARPDLMGLLHEAIARHVPWAASRSVGYLTNVHRPDGDTSGALLLARERSALVALANQFNAEPPVTTCLALAQGVPPDEAWEVEAPLASHPTRPGCLRVDSKRGKKARTRFAVIERFGGYALLRCEPSINRRHQVRLHLRHCGLCLVGDSLYGGRPLLLSRLKPGYRFKADRDERPLLGRAALHLERLTIRHPATGGEIVIESPTPKDFLVAVKFLRRYAPAGTPRPDSPEPG